MLGGAGDMAGLLRVFDDSIYGQAERDSALIERKNPNPSSIGMTFGFFEFGRMMSAGGRMPL